MKRKTSISVLNLLTILLLLVLSGCADRLETPVLLDDSTIFYPSKNADGIQATITLCTGFNRKTGEKTGAGNVFTIIDKETLLAFVDLKNCFKQNVREIMFHVDWVDSTGKSLYLKRMFLSPTDSSTTLTSGINISPDKRTAGKYQLRVYHFRELMAVKDFILVDKSKVISDIDTKITLSNKADKVDSVFISQEKESISASVNIENCCGKFEQELEFDLSWFGSDEKAFYRKKIKVLPGDSAINTSSSISISPEKRQPGKYAFRVLLFDEKIAEKWFEILPKPVFVTERKPDIGAKITFCKKIDKETGTPVDENTVFTIGENENVRAVVEFANRNAFKNLELKFRFDWIGPDGKSFYKKQTELSPDDPATTINSSVSISPGKRQPGNYSLRVFLFDKLVAEKTFELR